MDAVAIVQMSGSVLLAMPPLEASVAEDAETFLQGDAPLGREGIVLREPLD